jgi:hypothetical protein
VNRETVNNQSINQFHSETYPFWLLLHKKINNASRGKGTFEEKTNNEVKTKQTIGTTFPQILTGCGSIVVLFLLGIWEVVN